MVMNGENVEYSISLKDYFTGKLKDAEAGATQFEGMLESATSAANGLAAAVGIAFGAAAVVAFGSNMIQAGSEVENALTGLTTLLKDNAEAQTVINNTMQDAKTTPFAFEGLLAANKALISAGDSATQARTDVLNLANAIAATGGSDDELQRMVVNLQQIKNTGRATALDIKQFAYAGVNIYKVLADATGLPIEKTKDMTVTYDMLTMALEKAAGEGGIYANGLANMAGNTSVQISSLGDSAFQLSVKIFNDLKPAITAVISGMQSFIGFLTDGWNWIVKNKDIIEALAGGLLAGATAWGVYTLAMNASTIATVIETAAMTALGTAVEWVNAMFLASPIGWIVAGIAAITAGVIYAYNHFAKFRGIVWATWNVIKEGASIIKDILMGVGETIKGVLTFDPKLIAEGAANVVNTVRDTATRITSAAKEGYEAGLADFAKSATTNAPVATGAAAAKKPGANMGGDISPVTKNATGTKAITINVKIDNLIRDFSIKTTNIVEGTAKVREMVTQAMVSAINDSQLISE